MHKKPLSECTAAERDARWRATHEQMVSETTERFIADGASPREAERKATRLHEETTRDSRRKFEGSR